MFMNSNFGANELSTITFATKKMNPFETNSISNPQISEMAFGNGLLLKFAKDYEFMKFIGPSVNRTSIFDK